MIRFCASLILLAIAMNSHADSRLGNSCNLATLGLNDKSEFMRFDRDLRTALAHGDATATALLTQFPLRVNFPDDSHITLIDPATLQKQFDRVFTPELRDAVRKQKIEDLFCKYTGLDYADGGIWINLTGADDKQLRIDAVNVPGARADEKASDIDLACSTKQFRIVIDATGRPNALRYRVWNLPRGVTEKPDLELTGTRNYEGTSPCTHRIWHFKNGNAEYALSEPGCQQDAPPKNAAASLAVSINGELKLESWCF